MTFKTLLTFHSIHEPVSHVKLAIELARAANAHLDIIVLGVLVSPPVVMHDTSPAIEWVRQNNDTISATQQRVNEIEKLTAKDNVSASIIAECNYFGKIDDIAARYSLCADVSVINKNCLEESEIISRVFNGVLFESGCPILILPDEIIDFNAMEKIAIAWNGRAESAKAIHRNLPLLKQAKEVNVMVVDPIEKDVGEDPGDDIAAFLARYGIKVTVNVIPSGGKTVDEKLLQRAKDTDADLLVMGAYGHSKFRQWLLGGTTKNILQETDLPVLMVH